MTYGQIAYVNLVNRVRSCEEAICECVTCKSPLYYMDCVYKFDDEIYCEECFKDFIDGNFKEVLSDRDIPEPDWDE